MSDLAAPVKGAIGELDARDLRFIVTAATAESRALVEADPGARERDARPEVAEARRAREGHAEALRKWARSGEPLDALPDEGIQLLDDLALAELDACLDAAARERRERRYTVAEGYVASADRAKRLRAWVGAVRDLRARRSAFELATTGLGVRA